MGIGPPIRPVTRTVSAIAAGPGERAARQRPSHRGSITRPRPEPPSAGSRTPAGVAAAVAVDTAAVVADIVGSGCAVAAVAVAGSVVSAEFTDLSGCQVSLKDILRVWAVIETVFEKLK